MRKNVPLLRYVESYEASERGEEPLEGISFSSGWGRFKLRRYFELKLEPPDAVRRSLSSCRAARSFSSLRDSRIRDKTEILKSDLDQS